MLGGSKLGKVTVILDEDVEEWLRTQTRKKGDLSKIVNEALRKRMERVAVKKREG